MMLVLASACVAACNGKTIHLGDGWTDGGVNGGAGGSANGGTGGGMTCPHAQIAAAEVLWIGDSWVLVTGSQHTRVRDLAQEAGAIPAGADYTIGAKAASTMANVANQYAVAEAGSPKPRVLIMDGGTWDTIQNNSDATVNAVVNTFAQLLAQVASDGTVEQIIYFLMPEIPAVPGVAALRPPLQVVCASSTVPCHFLDLQNDIKPSWTSHADYTTSDGLLPTEVGSRAIADAIWAIMQANCIAQ